MCYNTSLPCLKGKATVEMITSQGKITFEIDGNSSPITSGNFLDLVKKGTYNGTIFHGVIKDPVPFVIKGGDPFSKFSSTAREDYGKGSFVDKSSGKNRFIPLEIKLKSEDKPRYSRLIDDPGELIELQMTHVKGALAMARAQALDSASSQFYIALKPLPELDGRYAVFGKVVKGFNVLDLITEEDKIISISLLGLRD